MNALRIALLGPLALALGATEGVTENVEVAKLIGTWKLVALEMPYGPVCVDDMSVVDIDEVVFSATKVTFKKRGETDSTGYFRVNSARTPKEMDALPDGVSGKKRTQRWIYQLQKNSLKLCYAMEQTDQRPRSMTTNPNSDVIILTLVRSKR